MTKSVFTTRVFLPNRIIFTGEIKDEYKNQIFDILIKNLNYTKYKNIQKLDNDQMIVKGEYFSFNLDKNGFFDIWTGFSKRAEISIIRDNMIQYKLDFTYGVINAIISFVTLFFLIPLIFQFGFTISYIITYLFICPIVLILSIFIGVLRHRGVFYRTLKYGSIYKGDYDWIKIFENKSLKDLEDIATGKTTHTQEVQELAKEQLIKRKSLKNWL